MRYLLSIVFIALFMNGSFAQLNVVNWSFEAEKVKDQEYKLVFTADLQEGWYIYSQYLENEGPIPTSLNFNEIAGFELLGKAEEAGEKMEGYDKVFMMDITKYKKELIITQKVKVEKGISDVSGFVEFMTCNDEQCLPPRQIDFTVSID